MNVPPKYLSASQESRTKDYSGEVDVLLKNHSSWKSSVYQAVTIRFFYS